MRLLSAFLSFPLFCVTLFARSQVVLFEGLEIDTGNGTAYNGLDRSEASASPQKLWRRAPRRWEQKSEWYQMLEKSNCPHGISLNHMHVLTTEPKFPLSPVTTPKYYRHADDKALPHHTLVRFFLNDSRASWKCFIS